MAERKYTYRVEVDSTSLAAAEQEIARRLGGAMANIQASPETQRAAQTTLADFQKLEAELKRIGQIDLTAPADKLKARLDDLRQTARQLDAEIRGSDVRGGGSTDRRYRARLDDYYTALAQAQGDEAAALARGRGVVGNIGQIGAQFANDTIPADEFTQNAFAQVEEVRQKSREEIRQLMEMEAKLYATQAAEAQAERAITAQRMAQLESQLDTDDDGRIMDAWAEAGNEQERLAQAEIEAAKSLATVKQRLREHLEQDAAAARKAALQSGDLSAAGGGGRLTVSVTQATATQAGKLADELERAAKMEERIAASVKDQVQTNRQRQEAELELVRAKGRQSAAAEALIEQERIAGAAARAETQKTVIAHAEAEKRITTEARAEATERAAIARKESAVKIEEAREARIRATEEERRQTAAHRAELSQRQRATVQSGGGLAGGIQRGLISGATSLIGMYGGIQGAQALYQGGVQGAQDLRTIQTFEALADRVGASAKEMQSSIAEASRNTINDMNAMRLGAQVLAQRFASSSDDIEGETAQLIKGARRLSQVYTDELGNSLTTQEVFSRIIKYVREGNAELVDQFGISNRAIAAVMGVTTDGLRGAEGAVTRWQGTIKLLGEEIARLGDPVDTTADRIEAAQARIANAADDIRRDLSNPVAWGLETVAQAAEGYSILAEYIDRPKRALQIIQEEIDNTDPVIQAHVAELDALRGEYLRAEIGLLEYERGLKTILGTYDQYISQTAQAAESTTIMAGEVFNLADAIQRVTDLGIPEIIAGGLVTRLSPSYAPGMPGDMDSSNRNYASGLESLRRQSAATREAAGLQAAMVGDVKDRFFRAIDEQEREQKRAADKTAAEWKRAADDARNAFASAARAVPGLFGSSPTTQTQIDRAGAGVPQNFADNYLRRLTDEMLNGVDWEGVDLGDAARRSGIDPGLPAEIFLDLFRESWESGRLFADPGNLDLIDLDAVQAEMANQRAGEAGQQNILKYLQGAGLGEAYGVSAAGQLASGIAGAIPGEFEAANIGGTAGTAIVQQFSAPAAMQAWTQAGRIATEGIFTGYQSAIDSSPFASVLVQSITAAVMANLITAFGPQNP